MTTSGTTTFNLDIDELFQEAYERIGIMDGTRSGYQLRSARRSLNLLLSEWDNRGVHLWKVTTFTMNLILGQAQYNASTYSGFPTDINDVLECYIRNNNAPNAPVDISLTKIDRSAYAALPNKLAQGTPSQYYVERTYSPSIYLYLTPGSNFSNATSPNLYQCIFYYLQRIQDAGAYTNTPDVIFRFLPALTAGMAYYLSIKYAPLRTDQLKMLYEDELQRALQEDSQRTSLFISPKSYFGDSI